ncbi:MAG: arylesterase [Acidobacteriaceae bacterium]|nr:arylesterase [Acidobacteriaceae bacterium]
MRRLLFPIVTALTLSFGLGCKTDASAVSAANQSPQAASPVVQTQTDTRPLLLCFGDSITAGYGIESGNTYPQDLQALLDQAGYHYRVVNAGISGNTTKDGLDRLQHLLARKPQLAVVEFGGNDALRGLPLEQTQQNLASIIEGLQATGAGVVLAGITIPPSYGAQYVSRFNAIYPALAHRYKVPYLPFVLQGAYGTAGDMQEDGIHPTAQGAQQVAKNIYHLLQPLLKH